MAIVVKINGGNTDFETLSEGVHPAVLADIVDLGIVPTSFGPKHKIRFVFVTDELDSQTGKQKYAFKRYTLSLHENASLRKDVKRLLGKDVEGETFDIESLLGLQTGIVIQHSEDEGNGKVYANITGYMKSTKQVAIPADFVRAKDKQQNGAKPANGGQRSSVQQAGGGRAAAAAVLSRQVTAADPISDSDIPF